MDIYSVGLLCAFALIVRLLLLVDRYLVHAVSSSSQQLRSRFHIELDAATKLIGEYMFDVVDKSHTRFWPRLTLDITNSSEGQWFHVELADHSGGGCKGAGATVDEALIALAKSIRRSSKMN
jgi:hypothetical protein